MRSLFWSIFLSFWAALILFSAATTISVSFILEQAREQGNTLTPRERMAGYAADAQDIATREGVNGLKRWLRSVDREELVPLLLLDAGNKDLLGRHVRTTLIDRLKRISQRSRWRVAEIRLNNGEAYRLTMDFQGVTFARMVARPRVLAMPVIVAALVSGLVCYLLARYLTAPLGRLRRATEVYATGQFDHRVSPTLGGRRDEIAELGRSFDHMAQRLSEVMNSQRQLLSDVSHELRSPLARLQVALGLARQRAEGRATEELNRIEREAERLNELIGQLLSLSRVESGVSDILHEPMDLAALLAEVASDADFEARANHRRVEFEVPAEAIVRGDGRLLQSAFENIVRNAVRYTAENTAVRVTLVHDPVSSRWQVRVRDQGAGVPDNMLSRLFEAFVRVGDARDRASGGYGLGLAIARRAILAHRGEVRASNHPDGGLLIEVWLPAA